MNIDFWPNNPKANFQNGEMNLTKDQITSYQLPVTIYQYKNKPKQTQFQTQFLPNLFKIGSFWSSYPYRALSVKSLSGFGSKS